MKLTENLKNLVKGLDTNTYKVSEIAKKLGKTNNSIVATRSCKDYLKYFDYTSKTTEIVNNEKVVKEATIKLSQEGLDLLQDLTQEK